MMWVCSFLRLRSIDLCGWHSQEIVWMWKWKFICWGTLFHFVIAFLKHCLPRNHTEGWFVAAVLNWIESWLIGNWVFEGGQLIQMIILCILNCSWVGIHWLSSKFVLRNLKNLRFGQSEGTSYQWNIIIWSI
jgi:hypothetical protein